MSSSIASPSDNPQQHSPNQISTPNPNSTSLNGPVAILWDIENCPVPSDVRPDDVAGNIRMALRVHPVINGAVTMFSAYGDFNSFPRRLREGCQRTGVKLIDVPNGRKDAADKAILVDMFLFALDNHPPSSIVLISGDVDFAPALHILGQRGYTIVLVIPSGVSILSALSNAGRYVWDWPSVARGEGFVPPSKALIHPSSGPNFSGVFSQISDNVEGQNEEESIVYRGVSRSYYNTKEFSMVSHSLSEYNSSSVLMLQNSTELKEASTGNGDLMWVQPGDLNGLKGQLVKLLEMSGGTLPLTRLPAEYQKNYGRPLYVSEYGALKLVNLLQKMVDAISVEGKGQKKKVCLRNESSSESVGNLAILARREKKGKGAREDNADVAAGVGSSDDEKVAAGGNLDLVEDKLEKFKCELQEIMVSYSCRVFLGCFEAIYIQRYKRQLDYPSFGVNHLEELLGKAKDVVMLEEEPVSKRKFIVAVGG